MSDTSDEKNIGYTYELMMKDLEELKKAKERYKRGEIDDGMSDECRKNWIEKCNS